MIPSSEADLQRSQIWERIPKTKEDWMKFMIEMIKHKTQLQHMSDKDIEGTIKRARGVLFTSKESKIDPDMPDCYYWKNDKVAEWINGLGFSEVKEMFLHNNISGKRLINIDACALNQMGLRNLTRTMQVTKHIRDLLQIPAPNALRAVMRLVPFELYLKSKARTGKEADLLNFKKFCRNHGFNYELVVKNKCARIKPTVVVQIKPTCKDQNEETSCCNQRDEDSSDQDDNSKDSENSLNYCPTVEFVVRKKPIRDQIIKGVYDKIIQLVIEEIMNWEAKLAKESEIFIKNEQLKQENSIQSRVQEIFSAAYSNLGIEKPELSKEKLEFVAFVADELVRDILKTRKVVGDLEAFQNYIENSIDSSQMLKKAQDLAQEILNQVSSIAALLALGQLDLSAVIREAPGLQHFVEDILVSAENELIIQEALNVVEDTNHNIKTDPVMKILSETKFQLVESSKKNLLLSPLDKVY